MTPSRFHLAHCRRTLAAGGLIAYPTEGVYGLGCDPLNPRAVERLLQLKGRAAAKGLILLAASWEQLQPFTAPIEESVRERVMATWPGPVTWILPVRPGVPDWLTGGRATVAARVTAHAAAAALCHVWGGALVSTSANPSGLRPARTPLGVRRYFGAGIDAIVHGPLGGRTTPTPILDALTGRVLRAG